MTDTSTEVIDDAAVGEQPTRRLWKINEYRNVAETRTAEESRKMALANLRNMIREEGYTIDEETLTHGDPVEVVLDGSVPVPYVEGQHVEPDGYLILWSVGARERGTDADDSRLLPVSLTYLVPEQYQQAGGDVTLRHNLAVPVTVEAYDVMDQPIGYLLATDLDEHQVSVEIVRNTARLVVIPDTPEGEGD